MGGGLMQLVAYGAQDVYLTGQPQITFFKVVYRRHTNFSVEPIQQTFQGAAEFGRTVTCNVNRNGDLITNMYLVATLKSGARDKWGYVSRLGHAMIDSCKIEVGGSKIDEQYGDWLNVWYELTRNSDHDRGYAQMIGDVDSLKSIGAPASTPEFTMYVPLQFWFNRNNGLALPLIALQYHDVRVTMKLREASELVNYSSGYDTTQVNNDLMKDAYLLIDYVYLDSEERKRFAQAAHEYLIEQVQFTGDETYNASNLKYRLNFNHPSKYLVWNVLKSRFTGKNMWLSWAFNGDWSAAKERFAKYLWLSTRANFAATNGVYSISMNDGTFEVGDVPDAAANLPATVTALLAKIDAQLLFSQAAGLSSNAAAASAENVVVLRNELTHADLNYTIAELTTGMNAVPTAFLTANAYSVRDYFNYSDTPTGAGNPVKTAKLQLNGHDRFTTRDGNYFNYVQPYQHFTNTPADGINVYSFALKPEDHQPSGTCNFSRIDNTTLNIESTYASTSDDGVTKVYAVNYNVFRVMSGMGGLAYSN
jgi:hypothetical protein